MGEAGNLCDVVEAVVTGGLGLGVVVVTGLGLTRGLLLGDMLRYFNTGLLLGLFSSSSPETTNCLY